MSSPRRTAPLLQAASLVIVLLVAGAHSAAAATSALSNTTVYSLASFDGRLWAGTDSGLYTLGSGSGATWTAVGGPLSGREINALAVSDGWLVAGTENGAVRTQDGSSWVASGLTGHRVASLSASGATLLAGTGQDNPGDGYVLRSDNSGGSWTSVPLTPALQGLPGQMVQAVLVPSGSSPAWAGTAGGGALRSSSGNGGWSSTSGMQSPEVTAFWRDPASGRLLAGTDFGLYAWSGSAWTQAAFPQDQPWVQVLATGADGHAVVGTIDGLVFTQTASGSWTQRAAEPSSVYSLLSLQGGGLLVGTSDGVSCIACPASVAAAASSPGAKGAHAAPSLPPPDARPGVTAHPGASASSSAGAFGDVATTPGALVGGDSSGGGSSGGAGPLRWIIVGVLAALSATLFAVGRVRSRRRAGAGGG